MIKSILQHVLSQGQSQRRCAQALGVSKGVVAKYVAAAHAAGLTWSAIVPPYVRRSRWVSAALPWLYLKGVSTGDMREALEVLLGAQDGQCPERPAQGPAAPGQGPAA